LNLELKVVTGVANRVMLKHYKYKKSLTTHKF